jgi:hypothetical protein
VWGSRSQAHLGAGLGITCLGTAVRRTLDLSQDTTSLIFLQMLVQRSRSGAASLLRSCINFPIGY